VSTRLLQLRLQLAQLLARLQRGGLQLCAVVPPLPAPTPVVSGELGLSQGLDHVLP